MKSLKYFASLLLSLVLTLLPFGGAAYFIYMPKTKANTVIAIIMITVGIMLNKPMQALRVKYRHDVENNEQETKYKNMVYSSTANYINLKDDKIKKYMLVANNYEPVPPREVFEIDMGEI